MKGGEVGAFANKTVFLTGGSRGIGRAMAVRLASEGANIVVAAKTVEDSDALPGTIYTVAREIRAAGGEALPLRLDIRDDEGVRKAVAAAVAEFGRLDIVINNASAISPTGLLDTPLRRYDLLMDVNTRGTYSVLFHALPHLLQGDNPHVLTLSPPLPTTGVWLGRYLAYALSKYGMTQCALGVAAEFNDQGLASNTLWPRTMISTDAVRVHYPEDFATGRHPDIMAEAAARILAKPSGEFSGHTLIDEDFLRQEGITDFDRYAITPAARLSADILLE
ncbi:SDR family NAD(P)-dependent oxidoreductase [Prauserella endophytica]|uniref:SDR family NAD(P)-dependent oxidoreductase n=1 Tax=Prauserella endophytica TaxID=1592324 RepID=A0ABY2S1V7_9PSEU|nr:SDR family NAD(P)-dependent oxidoreductase [Prauserella endophytica]